MFGIVRDYAKRCVFLLEALISWAEMIPSALLALAMRLTIAPVFWFSGRTKVDGFALQQSVVYQFQYDFGLPFPHVMALMAALAEHILPVLLVLGLGTRFAALGLFVMTLVIQFVFPFGWWSHHGLWLAILLYLVARGGGAWSLDGLVARWMR